jgi:hypothetical protein
LNGVYETTIESVRRRCSETAAEMQCPFHQRNARVIVDGDGLGHLEIEVFCCCDKFSKRVRDAMQETLNQA